jgi:hypothetical protein
MFKVKYEVMDIEDELAKVNRAIVADQDSIHVLKAEWSFLSQPSRLAELSHRYLELAPVATKQLGQIENVPLRPGADPATVASAAAPAIAMTPAPAFPRTAPVLPAMTPNGVTKLANAKPRIVP